MRVHIFVEGGGDTTAQRKPFRLGLGQWIQSACPQASGRVYVEACGGRQTAYEKFRDAPPRAGVVHLLLVDSEEAVSVTSKWQHVRERTGDAWAMPPHANETQLHFMAQTVETWLCTDPDGLERYFGHGFRSKQLPQRRELEQEPKADVNTKLDAATRDSRRGAYHKGRHLDLIGHVAPNSERASRCPHLVGFIEVIRQLTDGGA